MHEVISHLQRIKSRGRGMLILQRSSVMLAWTLGVLVAVILLDFALRLPDAFRLVLLLGGVAAIGYAVIFYLRAAISFSPSLTQMALRVEQAMPALAGRLASSVEFATGGLDQSNPLAARAVRDTQTRLMGENFAGVINPRQTWRNLAIFIVILLGAGTLAGMKPTHAATGVKRILLPYSDTKWPARTGVASMMEQLVGGNAVHPRGQALPLRAEVTRGDDAQRVEADYRLKVNGEWESWQRILLTHQGGHVHERLIDTNAEVLEIYFTTSDDRTDTETIELVPPPAVLRASLTVEPPAYAADDLPIMQAELGQGLDDRAVTDAASLIGSTATLRFELNKPLPVPDEWNSDARAEWMQSTFGWERDLAPPEFSIDRNDESIWTLRWTLEGTRVLPLNLVDEHGLANADTITFRIEAVEDRPPAVTITQPQSDETVLPTAVIALTTEARDDVALASLGLEAHLQSGGRTIEEALLTPPTWREEEIVTDAAASVEAELDLGPLNLKTGDVVIVTGVGDDVYGLASRGRSAVGSRLSEGPNDGREADESADGRPPMADRSTARDPVRSPPRRLRVIDEVDFATQLRRQLGAVRQNAIRIEALQGELQDDVIEDGVPQGSGLNRAQAQLGERIATQREAVEDIERAVRQNRLNDQQLSEILQQTQDLLDFAGKASNKAVEAVEQRANGETQKRRNAETQPATGRSDGDQDRDREGAVPPSGEDKSSGTPRDTSRANGEKSYAPRPAGEDASGERTPPQAGDQPREGENQAPPPENPQSKTGDAESPAGNEQRSADNESPSTDNDSPTSDDEALTADDEPGQEAAPEDRGIVEAQQEVRDELADLIKLLDRDEDTWVVKRQLETMVQEQAALEAQTGKLSQETMGKTRPQLSPEQQSELDKIAQKQSDLRDQAQKLIEEMRDRAKALEQVDPQSAEGMRQAADAAEQQQLDRDMQQAEQQVQQNQMTSAQASQQRSQNTMQKMLETMEETKQARAQELIRKLASLAESIARLVTVQENELNALGLAIDAKTFGGLDRSMIRLNQNTQAVAGEARAAGQDARRIARLLDRAADSQGTAIAALRAAPMNADEARAAEERALELLKEAKAATDEMQKKAEEDEVKRRREELMEAYRKLAEQQVMVRSETLPLSGVAALDRRQLVDARRLGSQQEQVRQGLNTLRDVTSEIIDSPIFAHIHRLMDQWSAEVTEQLTAGTVTVDATDRQQQIADSIGRLIKALEESMTPPDEFDKGEDQQQQPQEGQPGQQPQPLLPPVAQLKLLQGLQEQVYDLTKSMDGRRDLDEAQVRTRLRDVGQQQRELMELGQQMLEMLENGPQPPPAPEGEESDEEPGEDPVVPDHSEPIAPQPVSPDEESMKR